MRHVYASMEAPCSFDLRMNVPAGKMPATGFRHSVRSLCRKKNSRSTPWIEWVMWQAWTKRPDQKKTTYDAWLGETNQRDLLEYWRRGLSSQRVLKMFTATFRAFCVKLRLEYVEDERDMLFRSYRQGGGHDRFDKWLLSRYEHARGLRDQVQLEQARQAQEQREEQMHKLHRLQAIVDEMPIVSSMNCQDDWRTKCATQALEFAGLECIQQPVCGEEVWGKCLI